MVESDKASASQGQKVWCFALANSSRVQHIDNLTVPQFSQLTNKFGGKQSVNVILLKQDAEEDYIRLSENAVGKKSSLTPHTSILDRKIS